MIEEGRAQLALAQSDVRPGPHARMVAILYDDYFQLLAPKDSPIHEFVDLRGRRIAQPNSGELASLLRIAEHFGTPFHVYDEAGIRQTGEKLCAAFAGSEGFQEYFAVKALPNPRILAIMREMSFGFDCSSIPELILSRQVGARGESIM